MRWLTFFGQSKPKLRKRIAGNDFISCCPNFVDHLKSPWYIKRVYFDYEGGDKKLYIEVGHTRRTKFDYEGEKCPVYDHQDRKWRHLNFFQHECYLLCQLARKVVLRHFW